MNNRPRKWLLVAVLAPVAAAVFFFVGGEVVRRLWNWLLPPLFDLPTITFWQAWGLLVLSRLLFGGWGMHGGGPARYRRWERMTPEQRDRFRRGMCRRSDEAAPASESM